ncbi:rhomboid domain-containing protein 3 isoform X2 [Corythoichthys intestinalis]|uniref:rhomboid domain-containing protein 3 isoform X2 n=1 Tax=Corythoichthys intestinalis TaxID=161448 RepID=UPI0025A57CE9|nr:rhomboid domain-containing protein 3 isoform X2 [Corythoichthys intestinalis]
MRYRVFSLWCGSDRPGFFLGTTLLVGLISFVYAAGLQASLSIGRGGNLPRFRDVFLFALNHDDLPALLVSISLLLLFSPYQERRWGTVAYLVLSNLTMIVLPFIYTLVIFAFRLQASRICGYAAIQLALFTAQCRHLTKRRVQGCVPVWVLPWLLLLLLLVVLPGTPALLNFCAICIGHNYSHSFIGMLQELEEATVLTFIPTWLYIPTLSRLRLPTYSSSQMERSTLNHLFWEEPLSPWNQGSDAEALEEQMLRAGILASLQDVPDEVSRKVEVPKSSVSALRLQQLEKMGFPTEKAVVALAASKQLDGAISLLIDDRVGEQAVVIAKGKTPPPKDSEAGKAVGEDVSSLPGQTIASSSVTLRARSSSSACKSRNICKLKSYQRAVTGGAS